MRAWCAASVLSFASEYVHAAETLGARPWRVLTSSTPAMVGLIAVQATSVSAV